MSTGPTGYVFAVDDRVLCCWAHDHIERSNRFLSGFDPGYYERLAEIFGEHLGGTADSSASIALRATYHQAIETLFSMLGAYAQAPECLPAWIASCKTDDLQNVVASLRRGGAMLTQSGRVKLTIGALATQVLRHAWVDESPAASTAGRFGHFWQRLADEFLDVTSRAEYNAIKHGLRVRPGGFQMSIGTEETPGVPAPANAMRTIGGSRYGSTFFEIERLGPSKSPNLRTRSVSLNWSAQDLLGRLVLISLSITNIVASLRCELGDDPRTIQFVRPTPAQAFDDVWSPVGITSSRIDEVVRPRPDQIRATGELRAELEGRSAALFEDR